MTGAAQVGETATPPSKQLGGMAFGRCLCVAQSGFGLLHGLTLCGFVSGFGGLILPPLEPIL